MEMGTNPRHLDGCVRDEARSQAAQLPCSKECCAHCPRHGGAATVTYYAVESHKENRSAYVTHTLVSHNHQILS